MGKQAQISQYLAGLADGDASFEVPVERVDDCDLGYRTRTRVSYEFYLGGLIDAEGSMGVYFPTADNEIGHRAFASTHITMGASGADSLQTRLEAMLDELNIQFHNYSGTSSSGNETFRLQVAKLDSVRALLQHISPYLLLKRRQANVMLDRIIPLIEAGEHTNRRGFLKLAAWRDFLNLDKGGKRGKYNLEYFEEEWSMSLDLEKHGLPPDLRQRVD